MRHKSGLRKLNRTKEHRKALFRNMATSLVMGEKIETTIEKAKELRPIVERLVTRARQDTLANRRLTLGYLQDKGAVHKLFVDLAPRFRTRPGGYTRITRTRNRAGDAAEMAYLEFVEA